jgi:hypothetical protein
MKMTKAQDSRDSTEEQNVIIAPGASSKPHHQREAGDSRPAQIRELNDRLRTTGRGGMVVMTNGVGALGLEAVNAIFTAVVTFTGFNPDNDPWGEHDCAVLTVDGIRVIWKIDYLDRSRRIHSPDPTDPKVTVRVLTVMLAEEY